MISDLMTRAAVLPFGAGTGIPWGDPEFSSRLLQEHLCQEHDRASRRFAVIDQQVAWLQDVLLGDRSAAVLDLGCGPGLYTSRLARLGHRCVGVDLSPASIEYARAEAERDALACRYQLADLREATLAVEQDVAMMLFGEFNMISPEVAKDLLERVHHCLRTSGLLLLEVHAEETVRELGESPAHWALEQAGPFSDAPHLLLSESQWHADLGATTERFTVLRDKVEPRSYSQTTKAYSGVELEEMLGVAGFAVVGWYESLGPCNDDDVELLGLLAERLP